MLAIVGAGALGQVIAARLAAAGELVWLLATPRGAAELRAAGAIEITGIWQKKMPVGERPERGIVGLAATTAGVARVEAMIFATKAHQLQSAAAFWAALEPRWVAGIQNGMAKDDFLTAAFGPGAVVGATTIVGAQRPATGPIRHTGTGHTYFGELAGSGHDLASAVDAFNRAGLPATLLDDVRSAEWSKAANAAASFAVNLLARATNREQRANPDLVRAYLMLVRETAAIAAAEGVALGEFERFPVLRYLRNDEETTIRELAATAARMTEEHPSSMYQDLLAGRSLEVEPVFGDLVHRAARHGVAVPGLQLAYRLIRAIDPARNAASVSAG